MVVIVKPALKVMSLKSSHVYYTISSEKKRSSLLWDLRIAIFGGLLVSGDRLFRVPKTCTVYTKYVPYVLEKLFVTNVET